MSIDWATNQMFQHEEKQVRALYKLCYPGNVAQPKDWYFAHPTLVVTDKGGVLGYTTFTVTIIPGFGPTLYGQDICVHPNFRRTGIGVSLHKARLLVGYNVGARTFMGVASKENKSMIKILERYGAHPCIPVGEDTLFIGPIEVI